jgi:hypothetical protein
VSAESFDRHIFGKTLQRHNYSAQALSEDYLSGRDAFFVRALGLAGGLELDRHVVMPVFAVAVVVILASFQGPTLVVKLAESFSFRFS